MSTAPDAGLSIRGLACRRGERLLFEGLDLDVVAGEPVWLRAANGFGKTTLLRTVVGLAKPEHGAVTWSGAGARLYLAHANALKEDLTVLESIRHAARLHAVAASASAIDDALAHLGLYSRRHAPVRTLSQGQRRRVALIRLCLSPATDHWILDEPFDALDADGVACIADLIAAHAAGGATILFTSHVAPGPLADVARIVQLDAGVVRLDAGVVRPVVPA